MGSVGAPEILVILVLALVVLGPERLPQAARTMGRWMGEVRRVTGSLQAEVRDVVDEVMRPVNETATVATESFTSTFSTSDTSDTSAPPDADPVDPAQPSLPVLPVEADGPTTEALPSEASSDPLPADVPLPGLRSRTLPTPPADPSLN